MELISHGLRQTSYSSTVSPSRIVFDDKERVGQWALERLPYVGDWGAFEAIGLERDGVLIGAAVYNHYYNDCISLSYVGSPGTQWLTKGFLQTMFAYPFVQLGVRRITGYVASQNKASLNFAIRSGSVREGLMRKALPDDDIVVLGMLKHECRWLK